MAGLAGGGLLAGALGSGRQAGRGAAQVEGQEGKRRAGPGKEEGKGERLRPKGENGEKEKGEGEKEKRKREGKEKKFRGDFREISKPPK